MKAPHPNGLVPHRGYSGIGTEKSAAKSASETTDEMKRASLLKISDFKVIEFWFRLCGLDNYFRRATKSVAMITKDNTISGSQKMFCLGSARLLQNYSGY